jgi:hypothetical protein
MDINIEQFLRNKGVKDRHDMPESEHEKLRESRFYYICEDMQGWYLPKSDAGYNSLEKTIHYVLTENQEY